jgi:hypothetical protein
MPGSLLRAPLARTLPLLLLWAVTAGWMVESYVRDPYDPTLEGTVRYGHNGEGALQLGIVVSLVELLALLAVLRPWKAGPAWGRLLAAFVLLVPWSLFSAVMCMHAGGVIVIHLFWLGAVLLALGAALGVSAVAAVVRRTTGGDLRPAGRGERPGHP